MNEPLKSSRLRWSLLDCICLLTVSVFIFAAEEYLSAKALFFTYLAGLVLIAIAPSMKEANGSSLLGQLGNRVISAFMLSASFALLTLVGMVLLFSIQRSINLTTLFVSIRWAILTGLAIGFAFPRLRELFRSAFFIFSAFFPWR